MKFCFMVEPKQYEVYGNVDGWIDTFTRMLGDMSDSKQVGVSLSAPGIYTYNIYQDGGSTLYVELNEHLAAEDVDGFNTWDDWATCFQYAPIDNTSLHNMVRTHCVNLISSSVQ